MAFPWAHHQPVGAQQDLERIVIARPMMDMDFQGCVVLSEADLGRSIQAFGHIDGVAYGDESRIDLVCPHFEGGQLRLAVDSRKGSINRVETVGDFDAPDAWDVETGIKDAPLVLQIDLKVGVEIHRSSGIKAADVRQVSRDVARREIERAAKRDCNVSEVAADAVATPDDFRG